MAETETGSVVEENGLRRRDVGRLDTRYDRDLSRKTFLQARATKLSGSCRTGPKVLFYGAVTRKVGGRSPVDVYGTGTGFSRRYEKSSKTLEDIYRGRGSSQGTEGSGPFLGTKRP